MVFRLVEGLCAGVGEQRVGVQMLDYLRRHPEVAFLACKDFGYLGRSYLNGTERQNALPVPVVIVASRSEGAEQQVQPAADQNSSASVVA